MSAYESFEQEVKKNESLKILDTNCDGSVLFEIQKEKIVEDDSELLRAYEDELLERIYPTVPLEVKNPCPSNVTFNQFRLEMTKISDKIYKKVVKPSSFESVVDLERTTVTYDYSLFLEGIEDPFDSSLLNKTPGVVSVKDGIEPTPGCYLSLASMKCGEESLFWISHELMFGKLGCPPRIPPKADVLFQAKIIKIDGVIEEVSKASKTFEKTIKQAKKNFSIACDEFNLGNYLSSIDIYRKWIDKLENLHLANELDEEEQKALLIKMYQNLSICYNKVGRPQRTCLMIREMEKLTSIRDNVKALYAKGKANMMLDNFYEARKCFLMVESLLPDDERIRTKIRELNKKEEMKIKFEQEKAELIQKFKAEALEIQQKEEEEDDTHEQNETELEKFKGELEEFIADFKNSEFKCLSLLTKLETTQELEIAEELCRENQVELHGFKTFDNEEILYRIIKKGFEEN